MEDQQLKNIRFVKRFRTDEATYYNRHLSRKSKKDQIIEGNIKKRETQKLKNQIDCFSKK